MWPLQSCRINGLGRAKDNNQSVWLTYYVMADWKVKPKTAADHRRDWDDLQATVPMKGTAFYTENQFLDALVLHVGVHHESRSVKYRAAVVKRQELDLPPEKRWTRDAVFERRIQGLLAQAKAAYIKKNNFFFFF